MPYRAAASSDRAKSRDKTLSRWENEGGASRAGSQQSLAAGDEPVHPDPRLTNEELAHLRLRVIALENVLIALLAEGSERQRGLVREMAAYISPRPGFTPHPLTIDAAAHMNDLVERAGHYAAIRPDLELGSNE